MSSRSPLPSPSKFEDPDFPKYLPLRPDKPPFFHQSSTRIFLAILAFILIIAGAATAALFTGKHIQTTHFAKHLDTASMIVVTPSKVTSEVLRTQTAVVTRNVTVTAAQATVVVTKTVNEQVPY